MSAFLFVLSDKSIKASTDNELHAYLTKFKKIVYKFDWHKYEQCTFDSDRASGSQVNIIKIEAELNLRSSGKQSDELPRVIVPGFNPGKS